MREPEAGQEGPDRGRPGEVPFEGVAALPLAQIRELGRPHGLRDAEVPMDRFLEDPHHRHGGVHAQIRSDEHRTIGNAAALEQERRLDRAGRHHDDGRTHLDGPRSSPTLAIEDHAAHAPGPLSREEHRIGPGVRVQRRARPERFREEGDHHASLGAGGAPLRATAAAGAALHRPRQHVVREAELLRAVPERAVVRVDHRIGDGRDRELPRDAPEVIRETGRRQIRHAALSDPPLQDLAGRRHRRSHPHDGGAAHAASLENHEVPVRARAEAAVAVEPEP